MAMAQAVRNFEDAKNEFLAAIDAELSDLSKRQADIKRDVARLLATKPKRVRPEPVSDVMPLAPPRLERQQAEDLRDLAPFWDGSAQVEDPNQTQ